MSIHNDITLRTIAYTSNFSILEMEETASSARVNANLKENSKKSVIIYT